MLPPSLIHALDARLAGAALGPAVKVLHFGPEAEGRAVAEPLRALDPQSELGGMIDVEQLSHFAGDPEEPVPAIVGGHVILDELTPAAIDAVISVGGADTP
jgi:hypothetical protein